MKRLLAMLAGVLGLGALLRRRAQAAGGAHAEESRADDLRTKLAASRALESDRAAFGAGETPVDQVPDVDTRRADVHARARQAIDDLKPSGT